MLYRTIAALCAITLSPGVSAQPTKKYKRVHQQFLRQLLKGADGVAEKIRGRSAKFPQDAETWFMLAAAESGRGNGDAALAAASKAIEHGLQPGRLHGAPHGLLENLRSHPGFAELFAKPVTLVHGPLLGDVTATSVRVWFRTARLGATEVKVRRVDGAGESQTAVGATYGASDFATTVRIDGLQPNTNYHYELTIGEERVDPGFPCTFRTAPQDGESSRFVLAFGGGAGFVPPHERMWDTIGNCDPDLLLLLGDNIYSDDPKRPAMQNYCYHRRQSRAEFRRLVARTPTYAIWDDHDFGTNDCFGGPAIETPKWKRSVWNVFRRNWANPGYGGGKRQPGCWFKFQRGDVEFFLLDGRYYRSDPRRPNPSMLGPAQLAWLKRALAASRATFKVICSPVPWDYRTKGKSRDTWNGYRTERDAIFAFLADKRIEGVVLMSADRHRSDCWKIERENGYDLYEFNSSRLTNQHVHPEMKAAVFSYNKKQSFGLVTFDTGIADPTVRYAIKDIDGQEQHSIIVRRSELTHR